MITTNWKLLHNAKKNQIHFNISKLEKVIDYNSNDRSSINIWNKLQDMLIWEFGNSLFPESLEEFLEFHKISEDKYDLKDMAYSSNEEEEDLPF